MICIQLRKIIQNASVKRQYWLMFVVATKIPSNRLRLLRSQTHVNMRVMRQINRVIISFPVSFGDIPLPASVIGFSSAGVLPGLIYLSNTEKTTNPVVKMINSKKCAYTNKTEPTSCGIIPSGKICNRNYIIAMFL